VAPVHSSFAGTCAKTDPTNKNGSRKIQILIKNDLPSIIIELY
jgi:hypothetical protein